MKHTVQHVIDSQLGSLDHHLLFGAKLTIHIAIFGNILNIFKINKYILMISNA